MNASAFHALEDYMHGPRGLLLVWVLLLAGCGAVPKSLLKDYRPAPISTPTGTSDDLVLLLKQGANGLPKVDERCFVVPLAAADVDACTTARNAAVSALRMRSNDLCLIHRSTIYGNEAVANIALGTITNLASGAAAVVTHETTKSAFAALALFANSERSLVNETVYKQMLVPAIDAKILQLRAAKAAALEGKLKADAASYSFSEALFDLEEYHYSCSFMDGLQLALKEGVQPTEVIRESRLRSHLGELRLQMNAIPVAERTTSQKIVYDAMVARYQALSAELQKLELR